MKKFILVTVLILALLIFGCTNQTPKEEKQTCGGIAGLKCPDGYNCQYDQNADKVADAAGYCLKSG